MTMGMGTGMGFVGHPWGYILFNIMYIKKRGIPSSGVEMDANEGEGGIPYCWGC